jgi:hypothetical protein
LRQRRKALREFYTEKTWKRRFYEPEDHHCDLLIALGIVAFAYQGITYTTREKVVDVGPIHMTAEKTKTIPLPPILGALAIAGGIALLVVGRRKV